MYETFYHIIVGEISCFTQYLSTDQQRWYPVNQTGRFRFANTKYLGISCLCFPKYVHLFSCATNSYLYIPQHWNAAHFPSPSDPPPISSVLSKSPRNNAPGKYENISRPQRTCFQKLDCVLVAKSKHIDHHQSFS